MKKTAWIFVAALFTAALSWAAAAGVASGQQDQNEQHASDDPVLQMVADLLGQSDRDMRALALQQIREELPGESTTKYFAQLLSKLPPQAQAELIGALADRGDSAARDAVAAMLNSTDPSVRIAAIRALGALGTRADIAALVKTLGQGSEAEQTAARQSLTRLKDRSTNAALRTELQRAAPPVRAKLIGILAARNATEAAGEMLEAAQSGQPVERLAALEGLRLVAQPEHAAALMQLLPKLQSDTERRKAELALLAVCSRGGPQCAAAISENLSGTSAAVQSIALHALARAGGSEALEAVAGFLQSTEPALVDEAVRTLSRWPDREAVVHLLPLLHSSNVRHKVLAFRGLVRLCEPREDRQADVKTLASLAQCAERVEEKRLLLGALGSCSQPEALELAAAFLDDPRVSAEACLAVVAVAERLPADRSAAARAALEKCLEVCRSEAVCQRVRRLVEGTKKDSKE